MATMGMTFSGVNSTINIKDEHFLKVMQLVVDDLRFNGIEVGDSHQEMMDAFVKHSGRLIKDNGRSLRAEELRREGQQELDDEFEGDWEE